IDGHGDGTREAADQRCHRYGGPEVAGIGWGHIEGIAGLEGGRRIAGAKILDREGQRKNIRPVDGCWNGDVAYDQIRLQHGHALSLPRRGGYDTASADRA